MLCISARMAKEGTAAPLGQQVALSPGPVPMPWPLPLRPCCLASSPKGQEGIDGK